MFQKISGMEKSLWVRGGGSHFSVEKFCLVVLKNFVGCPPSMISNFWGIEKILSIIGGVTIFRLFFVDSGLSGKKCRWRALRCLRKLRVSKCFMNKKGISVVYKRAFDAKSRRRTYTPPVFDATTMDSGYYKSNLTPKVWAHSLIKSICHQK